MTYARDEICDLEDKEEIPTVNMSYLERNLIRLRRKCETDDEKQTFSNAMQVIHRINDVVEVWLEEDEEALMQAVEILEEYMEIVAEQECDAWRGV